MAFLKSIMLIALFTMNFFFNITDAIRREERLKRWKRKWKMELIEKFNPQWEDLFGKIGDACSGAGMTTSNPNS